MTMLQVLFFLMQKYGVYSIPSLPLGIEKCSFSSISYKKKT